MKPENEENKEVFDLVKDLQASIELSFQADAVPLKKWLYKALATNNLASRCYIFNGCEEKECPAYKNESGRCWLIAGTMCDGRPRGKFVDKYGFCTKCDYFQYVIGNNPVHGLRELIIILVRNLEIKNDAINDALSDIKILKGLLPICASCKKIRDTKGSWNQIECYITDHSEAEFTHSICPDCYKKLMDELNLASGN